MDLSMEIAERALEVVRGSIELAAARERDEAAARLLSELELEDASKKVCAQAMLCSERLPGDGPPQSVTKGCISVSLEIVSRDGLGRILTFHQIHAGCRGEKGQGQESQEEGCQGCKGCFPAT